MEHSIGTKITLEVVESDKACEGCYFEELCEYSGDIPIECWEKYRTDHKNIIYKEIKEN